jgi:hypothetical protein
VIVIAGRFGIAAILLCAAAFKFRDRAAFALTLVQVGIVRSSRAPALAIVVSTIEAALGAWLAIGLAPTPAFTFTALLFGSFALVIATAMKRGTRVPCNCFGAHGHDEISATSLTRASVLDAWSLLLAGLSDAAAPSLNAAMYASGLTLAAGIFTLALIADAVGTAFQAFRTLPVHTRVGGSRLSFREEPLAPSFGHESFEPVHRSNGGATWNQSG